MAKYLQNIFSSFDFGLNSDCYMFLIGFVRFTQMRDPESIVVNGSHPIANERQTDRQSEQLHTGGQYQASDHWASTHMFFPYKYMLE